MRGDLENLGLRLVLILAIGLGAWLLGSAIIDGWQSNADQLGDILR